MTDPDVVEAADAVNELYDQTNEIYDKYTNSIKVLNEQFRTIDGSLTKQRRQKKALKSMEALVKELEGNKAITSAKENQEELKSIRSKLAETREKVEQLGKSKRKTGSVFLKLIMGHVSVKLWNEGERLTFKQEYNRFKETWMPIFIILPFIQLYFGFSLALHQIQSFLAFYYYSSLAIRENILNVNGSRIQPWWIYHHYVTMISGIFFLLISDSHPLVTHNMTVLVNANVLWQSMVMVAQNNYQRTRHYTKKALAKKTAMDVRTSEVIDENPRSAGLFRLLIPALLITYGFQLFLALAMFYILYNYDSEFETYGIYFQAVALAICWLILPIGNFVTLVKVLARKDPNFRAIAELFKMDRKTFQKNLFFASKVLSSVMQSWVMYSMHLFKSLRSSASKLRMPKKKSSKKSSSSSKSSSKSSKSSKDTTVKTTNTQKKD